MKYLLLALIAFGAHACSDDISKPSESTDVSTPDVGDETGAPDGSPADVPPVGTLDPPGEGKGFQLAMEFVVDAHSEAWVCDIRKMPNADMAFVDYVEMEQTPGTHHLTLSFLGLTPGESPVPLGAYDCNDLYGDASLMQDQVMFFGNQGDGSATMQLPPGVAATLPGDLNLIYEMHYVNVTDQPVTVFSRINAWNQAPGTFSNGIWGGQARDEHIDIPSLQTHTEWSRCVMTHDVDLIFAASHMHARGVEFTLRQFDGDGVSEIFYSNDDWHVPKIVQYDPPMHIQAGQGFEWACTWTNEDAEPVNYGLKASDEMCNFAYVFTPLLMDATCTVVETSDGVLWSPDDSADGGEGDS
jgi:hypothetical protein